MCVFDMAGRLVPELNGFFENVSSQRATENNIYNSNGSSNSSKSSQTEHSTPDLTNIPCPELCSGQIRRSKPHFRELSVSGIRHGSVHNDIVRFTSERKLKLGDSSIELLQAGHSFTSITGPHLAPLSSCDQQQTLACIADYTESALSRHRCDSYKDTNRRFERAKEVLSEYGKVFIKAYPGDGSTHLAMDLLLTACETHTPFILAKPSEFQICLQSEASAIFLVDDAFGRTKCNASQMDKWMQYLNRNSPKIDKGLMFIFVVKQSVAKGCSDILDRNQACVVDLTDPELQLYVPENIDILRNMTLNTVVLEEQLLKKMANDAWSIGFPKRVVDFIREIEDTGEVDKYFFSVPSRDLINMVKALSEFEPSKLDVLALILLSEDNTINDGNISTKFGAISPIAVPFVRMGKTWLPRSDALELIGTMLKITDNGYYALAAPCVETAVLLQLGRKSKAKVVDFCSDEFFKRFVYPECLVSDLGLVIPLHEKMACNIAVNRLKNMILTGEVEQAVRHPLLRDSLFVAIFFSIIGKERSITRKVMLSEDKYNGKSIVSLGFATCYQQFGDGNPETFGGTILCHTKWQEIRKQQTEAICIQELDALHNCCACKLEDTFFKICDTLQIRDKLDNKCLFLAIESGASRIVTHLLIAYKRHLTLEILAEALLKACLVYCKEEQQTRAREMIIEALLKLVPFDYECRDVIPIVHYAGKFCNGRLLVLVDKYNGDINLKNRSQETCIHIAAKFDQDRFIDVALNKGADPAIQDINGKYPIHIAAERKTGNAVVEVLCTKNPESVEFRDQNDQRPIHLVCTKSNIRALELLLKYGVSVEVQDSYGQTPLLISIQNDDVTMFRILYEAGADVGHVSEETGDTILHAAVKLWSSEDMLRAILDISIKLLDAQNNSWYTALHMATVQRSVSAVQLLLEYGADVTKQNKKGLTALDMAEHGERKCKRGPELQHLQQIMSSLSSEMMKYRDQKGQPPKDIACKKGYVNTVQLRFKNGASEDSSGQKVLLEAIHNDDVMSFQILCEAGADVGHVSETGDTTLHAAVKLWSSEDMLRAILDTKHQLIDAENNSSYTALHMATVRRSVSAVQLLLEYGAHVKKRNKNEQTALELAVHGIQNCRRKKERQQFLQIISLLSSHLCERD